MALNKQSEQVREMIEEIIGPDKMTKEEALVVVEEIIADAEGIRNALVEEIAS